MEFKEIVFKNGTIEKISEKEYLIKAEGKESPALKELKSKEKKIYKVITLNNEFIYIKLNEDQEKLLQLLLNNYCLDYIERIDIEDLILEP